MELWLQGMKSPKEKYNLALSGSCEINLNYKEALRKVLTPLSDDVE